VPDFPKEGIVFKDITPLLASPEGFKGAIDMLAAAYEDDNVTKLVGAEARGFILGGAMAYRLGAGFIPARKPGKLPRDTATTEYQLEYGIDSLEMHRDSVLPGDRVVIIDDVLATGGTAAAKARLVRESGGEVVGFAFLLELDFLHGREMLGDDRVVTLVHVE
jgi:adenine phosphoribosyltransferase